ncbi:MAG: zinc ribbon domain-containing protein, partial [Candidatus Heimdallarchaeota archaeon]
EMIYKGKETKHVRLDCITKKIEAQKGSRYAPPPAIEATTQEAAPTPSADRCPGCGEVVSPDDKFCNNCGLKLH